MKYITPQDEVSQRFKTKKPDDTIVPLQKHFAPYDATLDHAGARSRRQRIFSTPRPLTRNLVVVPPGWLDNNVLPAPSRHRIEQLREAKAVHDGVLIRRQQKAEELHGAFKMHTLVDVVVLKPIAGPAGRPFKELSPSPEFPSANQLLEWYKRGIYIYVMVCYVMKF